MLILGLSAFEHDPAALLLCDGVVEAAVEENKLVRFPTQGVPHAAIKYCLSKAAIDWQDLDFVAFAARPFAGWVRKSLWSAQQTLTSPIGSAHYEAREMGTLSREYNNCRALAETSAVSPSKLLSLEHHLCHAAASFYGSPFDDALIVTLDEEGDGWSGMVALGTGNRICVLRKIPFPHSLGWVYSQVTEMLGFVPHREEHKVQWLSLGGEPVFRDVFLDMLSSPLTPVPHLNLSYFDHRRLAPSQKFYDKVGMTRNGKANINEDQRRAIASSLQEACVKVITELLEHYVKQHHIKNVCLGGGLFDNSLLVADLEKNLGKPVFVPPAPGNAGCALGAALLVWHQALKQPRRQSLPNVYWGPNYSRQDIKDVLDNCKAKYTCSYTELEKLDATVQLLEAGKIVAWYQGATEFGSRALGNRSLLASPWAAYVKENINDYVKHREWFRPFALAVPEDDCSRYFDWSQLSRFMTSLGWARPTQDSTLASFFLPGNRVRLHVVNRESNPAFWRLLKRFGEHAPAPILVNTSFNLFGEPLVVSPRDAVRGFYCSGIDALLIDYFLLRKHNGC